MAAFIYPSGGGGGAVDSVMAGSNAVVTPTTGTVVVGVTSTPTFTNLEVEHAVNVLATGLNMHTNPITGIPNVPAATGDAVNKHYVDSVAITMDGDVTGTSSATTVAKIQNHPVASTNPTAHQLYVWTVATSEFKPVNLDSIVTTGAGIILGTSGGELRISTAPPTGGVLVKTGSTYTPVRASPVNVTSIDTPTANFTVAAPSGTPSNGDKLTVRILSTATIRTPTWNSIYIGSGTVTPPTTLVASKTVAVLFVYDSTKVKWVCMAANTKGY